MGKAQIFEKKSKFWEQIKFFDKKSKFSQNIENFLKISKIQLDQKLNQKSENLIFLHKNIIIFKSLKNFNSKTNKQQKNSKNQKFFEDSVKSEMMLIMKMRLCNCRQKIR